MGADSIDFMLQALAIAIVSGLIIQIPLVLIVLPGFLQPGWVRIAHLKPEHWAKPPTHTT